MKRSALISHFPGADTLAALASHQDDLITLADLMATPLADNYVI